MEIESDQELEIMDVKVEDPVEMMDVADAREQQAAPSGSPGSGQSFIDREQLILSCAHAAAAMLEDEKGQDQGQRKTERARILIELLKRREDVTSPLTNVLIKRVHLLLCEKEDKNAGFGHRPWTAKAAQIDSVVKAGTYRNSIWQKLQDTVTPVLAALIAISDCNRNLDLLRDNPPEHWIHKLWLEMLKSPEAVR